MFDVLVTLCLKKGAIKYKIFREAMLLKWIIKKTLKKIKIRYLSTLVA